MYLTAMDVLIILMFAVLSVLSIATFVIYNFVDFVKDVVREFVGLPDNCENEIICRNVGCLGDCKRTE